MTVIYPNGRAEGQTRQTQRLDAHSEFYNIHVGVLHIPFAMYFWDIIVVDIQNYFTKSLTGKYCDNTFIIRLCIPLKSWSCWTVNINLPNTFASKVILGNVTSVMAYAVSNCSICDDVSISNTWQATAIIPKRPISQRAHNNWHCSDVLPKLKTNWQYRMSGVCNWCVIWTALCAALEPEMAISTRNL